MRVLVILRTLVLLSLVAFAITACSDPTGPSGKASANKTSSGSLSVYVVNYPLQYFVERIGGSHVRVTFPAPPDADPAYWEPTAEQIAGFQQADLIFLNGASYAKWVQRVSLPNSRMVDTSAVFSDRYIVATGQTAHSHGAGGEHQHGDLAFTTWLDPLQAVEQAAVIRDALVRLRPDAGEDLKRNFTALEKDLLELDEQLAAAFAAHKGQVLLFSHPVYQYLIRRYAIDGYAVHWEPDTMPGPDEWQKLDKLLSEHPARSMVWEGDPDPAIVEQLSQRGLGSLVFEPCANLPAEGDYVGVMRTNLGRLSAEL